MRERSGPARPLGRRHASRCTSWPSLRRWALGEGQHGGGGPRTPAPTREHAGQSHSPAVCGQGCKPAPGPGEQRASGCHHRPGRKPSPGQHRQSPPLSTAAPQTPQRPAGNSPLPVPPAVWSCPQRTEGSGDGGSELGSEHWGRSNWSSDGGTTGKSTRKRKPTEDGWSGGPRG